MFVVKTTTITEFFIFNALLEEVKTPYLSVQVSIHYQNKNNEFTKFKIKRNMKIIKHGVYKALNPLHDEIYDLTYK
ncbi:hypothetical protein NQ314_018344 [Rhamnusium bicolor]|uniref:Uncharacterized protein n=1 Tax=Rhamnusium bicolor TaxID=1586634 RepID=A0AAV8WRA1_9CUCU|nr:hypothetical protein NQ314_018344 [Rhamnusium bicolor]